MVGRVAVILNSFPADCCSYGISRLLA